MRLFSLVFICCAILNITCIKSEKSKISEYEDESLAVTAISAIQTQLNSLVLFASQSHVKLYSKNINTHWSDSVIADGNGIAFRIYSNYMQKRNDGLATSGHVQLFGNNSKGQKQDTVNWVVDLNDSFKITGQNSIMQLFGNMQLIQISNEDGTVNLDVNTVIKNKTVAVKGVFSINYLHDIFGSVNPPLVINGNVKVYVNDNILTLELLNHEKNNSCNTLGQTGTIKSVNSKNNVITNFNLDPFNTNACDFVLEAKRNAEQRILNAW